jgi:hypothetical protein
MAWYGAATGATYRAEATLTIVTGPLTKAEVRDVAEHPDTCNPFGINIGAYAFDTLQAAGWPARSSTPYAGDAWLVFVIGAGGFAGGNPWGQTAEDLGTCVVGDACLSAMLEPYGRRNECPEVTAPGTACSPDAQMGTMLHELAHAAFALDHGGGSESIMDNPAGFVLVASVGTALNAQQGAQCRASRFFVQAAPRTIFTPSETPPPGRGLSLLPWLVGLAIVGMVLGPQLARPRRSR